MHASAVAHLLLKGLLEKDVNKRLGAAKGTMFSIGGVTALKQHAFFEGIDWQALFHKEIAPPIDVTPKDENGDGTQNFHEEFTSQQISQSMIEVSSASHTRSHTLSLFTLSIFITPLPACLPSCLRASHLSNPAPMYVCLLFDVCSCHRTH